MYRIHFPFLDFALNIQPYLEHCHTVRELAANARGKYGGEADVRLLEAIHTMGADEIHEGSCECIKAAMQIVTVFDGVANYSTMPNLHDIAFA
jgi:hypothetical protein